MVPKDWEWQLQTTLLPTTGQAAFVGVVDHVVSVARDGKLPHLESFNLYATKADDDFFAHLQRFPLLKRLYLWQTKVTLEAANPYAEATPLVSVDTEFTFSPVEEKKSK